MANSDDTAYEQSCSIQNQFEIILFNYSIAKSESPSTYNLDGYTIITIPHLIISFRDCILEKSECF